MALRNLAIEKNAVDTFARQKGAQPANPQDWAQVYRLAYPNGDLPDELKATTAASLYGTLAQQAQQPTPAPTPAINVPTPTYGGSPDQTLNALGQQRAQAQAGVEQMSQPTAALKILQDAIKTKIDTQNANIGESEVFSAAGLKGMPVLNQSLAQTGKELQDTRAQFTNTIQEMTGQYKDMATLAMFKYNAAVDAYDKRAQELQQAAMQAQAHKDALDTLFVQNDLQKKLIAYQNANPDFATQVNALESGFEVGPDGRPIPFVDVSGAQAADIAKAIKLVESGGNYNAKGASGENGAYQFMPSTWKSWSEAYAAANGIKQSLALTPSNQDKVAEWKIQQWLDKGYSPEQIAAAWNAGEGSIANDAWKTRVGTNSMGVKYDTPSYVKKVTGALKTTLAKSTANGSSGALSNAMGAILPQLPAQQAKAAQAEFDRLAKSGDTNAQKEFIEQQAINIMPAAERSKAIGRQVAIDQLDSIQQQLNAYKAKGGNTNIFTGTTEEIANKVGQTTDTDLRKIGVNITTAMIAYRSSVSGAAFTDSEQKQYDRLFPSTGAVSNMNEATIAQLKDSFTLNQGSAIKSVIGPSAYKALQGYSTPASLSTDAKPPLSSFIK